MDDQFNAGIEELKSMIRAVSELVKDVPKIEMRIDEVQEVVRDLVKSDRSAPGDQSTDVHSMIQSEINGTLGAFREEVEEGIHRIQESLETWQMSMDSKLRELATSSGDDGTSEMIDAGTDRIMGGITELRELTHGQYNRMTSMLGDVELNLLAQRKRLATTPAPETVRND